MKIITKNNDYYYDNATGLIVPGAIIIQSILNIYDWKNKSETEIINLLDSNFDIDSISFYYKWLIKYESFKSNLSSNDYYFNVSDDLVEFYLLHSGFKELILSVTENCNFRCSYCLYSDQFSDSRNHSSKSMEWDIAKKAVDIYLNYYNKGKKYNLFRDPVFGFYGENLYLILG